MTINTITISGAKVHNLNSISLEIPKNTLTVITGPSGSGKSSLAFDTIYVEGQRRYIESLSSYARQFLGQFQPPEVESITGLSPAIAIDQKSTTRNPRSTVGTVTEIYDYLRILFARVGDAHCPDCKIKVQKQSPQKIVAKVIRLPEKTKIQIISPVIRNKKGEHRELIAKFLSLGFTKARIDGETTVLDDSIKLDKNKFHNIELIIDRILVKKGIKSRLVDSIETALKMSSGHLILLLDNEEKYYSEHNYCGKCDISFPELEPRLFSFNSPLGACKKCNGLGVTREFTKDKVIFDPSLPLQSGGFNPKVTKMGFLMQMIRCIAEQDGADLNLPLKELPKKFLTTLFEGSSKVYNYSFESENSNFNFKKKFPGLINWIDKKYKETSSDNKKIELEKLMDINTCTSCKGQRLNAFALGTTINDKSIMDINDMTIENSLKFSSSLKFTGERNVIASKLLKEIDSRLIFMMDVGLHYLNLGRSATTLSGGEAQRIRLATQIGSALSGVLYVLDEPSIGLHQRDNNKLIRTLKHLRDLGNTVIVVEHDEETMKAADFIFDMGPGAGIHGGNIVAKGDFKSICNNSKSLTGKYLSHKKRIEIPASRRTLHQSLKISGATKNNIEDLSIEFPLGGFLCITGVSGSGKSTLIHEILVPGVKASLKRNPQPKNIYYNSLTGVDQIQSVIELDQSPIGRTPNSNPATYSGLFDPIRTLFSQTNESKVRGYKPGRFSFNVKGGRCDECEGNGVKKIEMHFLPDVFVTCTICNGNRYNNETLCVLYKGKNIAEILDLTIEEARDLFVNQPRIYRVLNTLYSVGLGYMKLGQPATTLSGGEAQRLKLSKELAKRPKGHCFYVLDEPTTGLHFQDIMLLLNSLQALIDQGHTVLVIEHNLDVIKCADWIIDLGPEGGDKGGEVVAKGTPEEISKLTKSHTGKYLKKMLKK
ncbi:MAG: excinuclease ABC subunit UvrA [Bacteriovoracaceae bacterium]|jgi:excinuclease ABC subunit A|nr:excinuclease ABC subunit UvrA [Bacteriovoracaceae bacterium]